MPTLVTGRCDRLVMVPALRRAVVLATALSVWLLNRSPFTTLLSGDSMTWVWHGMR